MDRRSACRGGSADANSGNGGGVLALLCATGAADALERLAADDLAQVTGGTCRLKPIQAEFGKECPPSEPCWDDEWDACETVTVTKVTDNGSGAIVLDWHVGLGGECTVLEQDNPGDCVVQYESRRIKLSDEEVEWGEGCVQGGVFDLCGPGYVLCAVANTYELNDTTCQTPIGTIDLGVCGCRPEYMMGPSAFLALQPSE